MMAHSQSRMDPKFMLMRGFLRELLGDTFDWSKVSNTESLFQVALHAAPGASKEELQELLQVTIQYSANLIARMSQYVNQGATDGSKSKEENADRIDQWLKEQEI